MGAAASVLDGDAGHECGGAGSSGGHRCLAKGTERGGNAACPGAPLSMNSLGRLWSDGHLAPIEDLLLRHKPKDNEEDLRGFEWHYLWRLSHSERFTLRDH